MTQDPQLSRIIRSLRQAELNKNAASEKRTRYRQNSFSRKKSVQPARIIECAQNAVELRRLINTWTSLDKAQKKSISKLNSTRFNFQLEHNELISGKTSDVNLLLPPGFRFHSNGEPKKGKQLIQVSKAIEASMNPESKMRNYTIEKVVVANDPPQLTEKGDQSIDTDINLTEIALEDVETDRRIHAISRKISQIKGSLNNCPRVQSTNDLIVKRKTASNTANREPVVNRQYSVYERSPRKSLTTSLNETSHGFLRGTFSSENKKSNGDHSKARFQLKRNSMTENSRGSLNEYVSHSYDKSPTKKDNVLSPSMKFSSSSSKIKRVPSLSAPQSSQRSVHRENLIQSKRFKPASKSSKEETTRGMVRTNARKSDGIIPKPRSSVFNTRRTTTWNNFTSGLLSDSKSNSDLGNSGDSEDEKDDTVLKISTEETYRHMMRKASITDEQKLAKLSEMMDNVALGEGRRNRSTSCHINARQKTKQKSSTNLGGERKTTNSLAALKSMVELEAKSSRAKVHDFLQRLPTPDVTIRRWRTSKGDMQVIERRCEEPDDNAEDNSKDSPQKAIEEKDIDGDSDHASVSTSLSTESEDSGKLAINTALCSWPSHWAQRAAFLHKQASPTSSVENSGERDPAAEFKKLLKCRYLRIPPRMLKRNSSALSTTSTQTWR